MSVATHVAARLALRAKLKTLVIASSAGNIAAVATGFTRASGSFITEGFYPGFEVTQLGFPKNITTLITDVSDLAIKTADAPTVAGAAIGQTLSSLLPVYRRWGKNLRSDTPPTDRPYILETYQPAPSVLLGQAVGGTIEKNALYIVQWFGLPNLGDESLTVPAEAIIALFAHPLQLPLATGQNVRVRGDMLPFYSIVEQDTQQPRPVCTTTVAIRIYT